MFWFRSITSPATYTASPNLAILFVKRMSACVCIGAHWWYKVHQQLCWDRVEGDHTRV